MKNIRLLTFLALTLSALFCNPAHAQTISTIACGAQPAGGFPAPLPAEGVPAMSTTTWLNAPSGIVKKGTDIYIADETDLLVRKIDASGTITLVAGTAASF